MFKKQRLTFLIILACVFNGPLSCGLKKSPETKADAPINNLGPNGHADVLLFVGKSIWVLEAASLRRILYSHGATYQTVDDSEMNDMTEEDFKKYKALVIPGGDAEIVSDRLFGEIRARIRDAVLTGGLNYLGFCAGAWLAVAPVPPNIWGKWYGLGLIEAPLQEQTEYYKQGKEHLVVDAMYAKGSIRRQLWYGGPVTPEVPGGVVARYPDGQPAITQIMAGKGLVVISGLHPAADKPMMSLVGIYDADAITPNLAWDLLYSVINKKSLPTFPAPAMEGLEKNK